MRTVHVGLVGCGTVGSGVIRILQQHREDIARHQGVDLEISLVSSRTLSKITALGVPKDRIVADWHDIVSNPDIDIVVELIGGTGVAADVILEALKAGKNVVTANKAVMASRGEEVFAAAEEHNCEIGFEGAVGGGIPIIGPLKHSLTGNEIDTVLGIVNGTTNYMLSRMNESKLTYAEALAEAQAKGFAEADPTADVDGLDAAAKIAILASIAFNSRVTIDQVPTQGIRSIAPMDFQYASRLGYQIKLLAIAHKGADGIDVRVHPAMLSKDHPLADVNGVNNAIFVHGDSVGNVMFYGEGAGSGPAASAVMGDIIEVGRHVLYDIPPIVGCTCTDQVPIKDPGEISSRYYMRFYVADEPGVLTQIAQSFGDCDVSIASVMQAPSSSDCAELIFMTHHALEANIKKALDKLFDLDVFYEFGSLIRIEEEE